ncbi:hypothetical protein MLAC_16230 [Mycobacterium lacus]|uniref:Uncharacterized protein n=1 Tax=Mycobacterium lacus TaxID=169765 RepID=A0A7I7NJ66_9MYCO|nr:hypothetical protein MLAC_16230 [Mycobacterium lacus]
MTFDPGSITKPARGATIVKRVFGVNWPRNCNHTTANTAAATTKNTAAAVLYGGIRGGFSFAGMVMTATR